MVNLMRGLQLGLTAATGQGPTSGDFRAQDLVGELQGMDNPLESVQFQDLAQLRPQKASHFSKAIGISGAAGKAREKAMAQDIQKVSLLVNAGETSKGLQLLNNRKAEILKQNGDPSDTDELISMLEGGDSKKFLDSTALLEQIAINEGLLPPAKIMEVGKNGSLVRFGKNGPELMDIEGLSGGKAAPSPRALVRGLNPEIKAAAIEAFNLAGGGKDGVKALNDAIEISKEGAAFKKLPEILQVRYPNATEAEMAQINDVIMSSKNTSEGLQEAEKIRGLQRKKTEAKDARAKILALAISIRDNPELNDVVGSVDSFRFLPRGDNESNAIADIEEMSNLLTVDNLKLMTGVLSESDIKIIRAVGAGGLDRSRSDKEFIRRLNALISGYETIKIESVNDKVADPALAATVGTDATGGTDVNSLSDEDLFK
jgi:hypothetical protein